MSEEEIQKAIEKGKLPMTSGDYIGLGIFIIVFSAIIIISFVYGSIYFAWLAILLMLIGLFSSRNFKKLSPLPSSLPANKKALILYTIADGPDVYNVTKENNCYNIYFKASWLVYAYKVIALYDDSGYYIVSHAQSFKRGAGIRVNKTKEVIAKIKALEDQQHS